jgi:hypothetical protein
MGFSPSSVKRIPSLRSLDQATIADREEGDL